MSWYDKAKNKAKDMTKNAIDKSLNNGNSGMQGMKMGNVLKNMNGENNHNAIRSRTEIPHKFDQTDKQREEIMYLRSIFKPTNRTKYVEMDMPNRLWRVTCDSNVYPFEYLAGWNSRQQTKTNTYSKTKKKGSTFLTNPINSAIGALEMKNNEVKLITNMYLIIGNHAWKNPELHIPLINQEVRSGSREHQMADEELKKTIEVLKFIISKQRK